MTRRLVPAPALTLALAVALAAPAGAAPERHGTLPVVSPDGKRIAYVSDHDSAHCDVRVIGANGKDDALVASPGLGNANPAWSADGKRVVYSLADGDSARLLSVRRDGSDPRVIVALLGKGIRLSPDGGRIAYTSGSWTRNRIVVARADGGGATAITDSSAGYFNLAWSPAGDRIATTRRDAAGALEVWVMNADGSGRRPVARFAPAYGKPQWPAWSPDGKRLAIQAGTHDPDHPELDQAYIWVIDLATGQPTRLGAHDRPRLDETPSWFPDSRRIAFQSNASGRFEVWVTDVEGAEPRQITR